MGAANDNPDGKAELATKLAAKIEAELRARLVTPGLFNRTLTVSEVRDMVIDMVGMPDLSAEIIVERDADDPNLLNVTMPDEYEATVRKLLEWPPS